MQLRRQEAGWGAAAGERLVRTQETRVGRVSPTSLQKHQFHPRRGHRVRAFSPVRMRGYL